MGIVIDLSNNTKYPDLHEFVGFSDWTIVYIHIEFWVIQALALVGNPIVLVTSIKYSSLNMDEISCRFLENLAVADLILAVIGGWPIYITFVAKRYVLGKFCCIAALFMTNVGGVAEILILATISLYRALSLKYPLQTLAICSTNKAKKVLVLIWVLAWTPPLISLLSNSTIYYEPKKIGCTSVAYYSSWSKVVVTLAMILLAGIPMLCIVVSNFVICIIVIRAKRKRNRLSICSNNANGNLKTVYTVSMVCLLFIVSWCPYIVRVTADAVGAPFPVWFHIFQIHLLSLNVALNPVIYTITSKSFREVVMSKVFRISS